MCYSNNNRSSVGSRAACLYISSYHLCAGSALGRARLKIGARYQYIDKTGHMYPHTRKLASARFMVSKYPPMVPRMRNILITAFSTTATICGIMLVAPQIIKTLRTKSATGVSLGFMLTSFASWFAWVPYMVSVGNLRGTLGLVIPGTLQGVAVFVVWRHGADRTNLAVAPLMLLLVGGAYLVGGWSLHLLALGTTLVWAYLPAIISATRSPDISGISIGSWLVGAGSGGCWFVFGLLSGATVFVYTGALNLLLSATMITIVTSRTPRTKLHSTTHVLATCAPEFSNQS